MNRIKDLSDIGSTFRVVRSQIAGETKPPFLASGLDLIEFAQLSSVSETRRFTVDESLEFLKRLGWRVEYA